MQTETTTTIANTEEEKKSLSLFQYVPVNLDGKNPNESVSPANAFTALAVGIMKDGMTSSDTKYFMFLAMMNNLKKIGYSDEALKEFRGAMVQSQAAFTTKNDFMG